MAFFTITKTRFVGAFVLTSVSLLAGFVIAQEGLKNIKPKVDGHGASMSHGSSTDGPQTVVNVLRQDPYADNIDGEKTTATLVEVVLDPLAASPPHRHPGPVTGYILEGTFEFQVEGGKVLTLKAGDSFFESKMILHKVGRNPDKVHRTRVLAIIVHPSSAKSIMIMEPLGPK